MVAGIDGQGKLDGGAGAALLREAGPQLLDFVRAGLAADSRLPGSVVLTPAFQLAGVKQLALVVVRPTPTLDQLRQALQKLAFLGESTQSVACAALGTGSRALPAATVAQVTLEVLRPMTQGGRDLHLYLPGQREYQAFCEVARRLRLFPGLP